MQLHTAAARGDINGMTFALEKGAEIDAPDSIGRSALVFALERARAFSHWRGQKVTLKAVEFLIDSGANLEACDSLGDTALHHAAKIPDPAFLNLLLLHGANPKHVTPSVYSTLLNACYQPQSSAKIAIIEILHSAGLNLNTASQHGEFPLGVCLRFGDLVALQRLIQLGADPTPLHWSDTDHAVVFGTLSELERLSPSNETINSKNQRFELSPWLLASIRGDFRILQWLAERGADLKQTGRRGISPLHFAAEFGRLEALSSLLDFGIDANICNDFGDSPLHYASTWNHRSIAHKLIRAHADVNRKNHVGSQPIHEANSVEMIQLLVEGGADVNAIDGCGEWPLKSAAENNDVKLIKWLLDHGADVDLTSTGETALHTAVSSDARESMEVLLQNGANPNAPDVDGWTPLCGAESCEAIHALLEAGADPSLEDQAGMAPEEWFKDPILIKALKGD
ncbi:MAG: ankyrin repeat domain-containing protein [Verrucomicrobiota bacterium]